jgi:23S rRNA (adenine2030-N6)-methyltransferase
MNYRHAYHAGNFADVFKHAVLALLIERLKEKETPFRIIDTHAGVGFYDLTGDEAMRTGEWRQGIKLVAGRKLEPALAGLLKPYLDIVGLANGGGELTRYPGSPWIARKLLRGQDRLTAIELHPDDAAALGALFRNDRHVKAIALDGWLALGSFVPPKERRGLVLVDPPFEARDDFDRLVAGLKAAHRRWPTGIYALWYPVKDLVAIDRFRTELARTGIPRLVRTELLVRSRSASGRFNGAGLVICNPPWRFEESLDALLKGLCPRLADGPGAGKIIDIIAGEPRRSP